MDSIIFRKPVKTYANMRKSTSKPDPKHKFNAISDAEILKLLKREPLTTKRAVELLLEGTLRNRVCRYCLNIVYPLSELDQYMSVVGRGALYEVTIRDMVASFHPFQVTDNPNFPNKICNKCLNQTIKSYYFAQQCEQAERALRNCFEELFEKVEKLDPLERVKKRGRQKLNPNYNKIYVEHHKVMDYAEPIRHLINSGSVSLTKESVMDELECKKCWQILPNIESLVNHEKMHPKTMWYHCRVCGKSFAKSKQIKNHMRDHDPSKHTELPGKNDFECKQCGFVSQNYLLHLQHVEKHKYQTVLEHLIEKNMDKLCAVCLEKGKLVGLDKIICLHGGYPQLSGENTLPNILGSILPEMNVIHNYTGTKICESCLNYAISSYVFINRTQYIRNRLDLCVTKMLDNLNQLNEPKDKLIIEIAPNSILPDIDHDDIQDLLLDENDDENETELKVDVLEDEYRLKSESEESDVETEPGVSQSKNNASSPKEIVPKVNKTKLVNGYQTYGANKLEDVCSEFLTFKKKRKQLRKCYKFKFTCPLCSKHFISDYFLKRHVLKHIHKKVKCNICWHEFKSKFYLREHVKTEHLLGKKVYTACNVCGRTFHDAHKLKTHEKSHRNIECELCSKIFDTQKHYDSHMQRHVVKIHQLKKKHVQTCSFCEKECSNDNKLSVHVNKIHLQIKPYSCDMCERQFFTESNLQCHKKTHRMIAKEICQFCNKTLKCRNDLVVHVRKHIGIKPFKCCICTQTFFSEIKMKCHMKKWHGGSFCCRLCKKVFVNKFGLKNHVNRAHSVF